MSGAARPRPRPAELVGPPPGPCSLPAAKRPGAPPGGGADLELAGGPRTDIIGAMTRRLLATAALLAALLPAAAHAARREKVSPSFGFRLGGVTAVSSASPDTLTAIGGGAYALFDIPDLLVDVSGDVFAGEDRARLVSAGAGAYLPLAPGETTPYLGGGLKIGWSRFGGDGTLGLHPFGALGVLIGRSWSPQIRLEVAWFFTTGTERRGPGFPSRHANGPVATFGIGF